VAVGVQDGDGQVAQAGHGPGAAPVRTWEGVGCANSVMAAEQPVHAARRLVWCASASRLRRLHVLSKLAYLMLCRSIQLLVLLARGELPRTWS